LVASIGFGYEFVTALSHTHFDAVQRLFCGPVLGFVIHAWIALMVSYPFGLTRFDGILCISIFAEKF
jgi:hypothetical protein